MATDTSGQDHIALPSLSLKTFLTPSMLSSHKPCITTPSWAILSHLLCRKRRTYFSLVFLKLPTQQHHSPVSTVTTHWGEERGGSPELESSKSGTRAEGDTGVMKKAQWNKEAFYFSLFPASPCKKTVLPTSVKTSAMLSYPNSNYYSFWP